MTIVHTIYYHKVTGDIISYQEGGAIPPIEEMPKDCEAIYFDDLVQITDPKNFRTNMKVDPITRTLVPLKTPKQLKREPVQILPPELTMPLGV